MWSFLYGSNHGKVEIILDNAPARSAALLAEDRVDAALVPVIAYQQIEGVKLVPDVCVGAKRRVRSVCLATRGAELSDVRSVSLDLSSKTSVVLTKIIFREFLGFEPEWRDAEPHIDSMLEQSDAALLIGDPALAMNAAGGDASMNERAVDGGTLVHTRVSARTFDLAELWHHHTGLGFVFAMWMTKRGSCEIDFAAARHEGVAHIDAISANYSPEIGLSVEAMRDYLSQNISYEIDDSMRRGMELYFDLAKQHCLISENKPLEYI